MVPLPDALDFRLTLTTSVQHIYDVVSVDMVANVRQLSMIPYRNGLETT
jgi:hypothetical protein